MLVDAFSLLRPGSMFIQIGANDGLTHDPFREAILSRGWYGLLVEPQPEMFAKLRENYAGNAMLDFENCAIGEKNGTLELWRATNYTADPRGLATLISSFDRAWVEREVKAYGIASAIVAPLSVPVFTLARFLERRGLHKVDAFFVDTEGHDAIIVQQIFECFTARVLEYLPRVIVYEHSGETDKAATGSLLAKCGYRLDVDGNNTVGVLA